MMSEMWSDKKLVNIIVNSLLFLMGINFGHFGQIFLPIICLIIFIDNHFQFKVHNPFIFIILCLFGVSFYAFSYKQGFYSVMGFCLPMAYYLGCNLRNNGQDNIKNLIYLFSLAMICHVLLNFALDFYINKWHMFASSSHYDIWLLEKVSSTATAINYILLIGIVYYLFIYENNKTIKGLLLSCFVLAMLYTIGLGQRTLILMLMISLFVAFIADYLVFKNKKINIKYLLFIITAIVIVVVLFALAYSFDINNFREKISNIRLFAKFIYLGLGTSRLDIFKKTLRLFPYNLFGNRAISTIMGIEPHDLWMDSFDWGGIVTLALLIIYTIWIIIMFLRLIKNKNISNSFKILLVPLFICISLQMMMEPIISGASLFLIVVIIIFAAMEGLNKDYE